VKDIDHETKSVEETSPAGVSRRDIMKTGMIAGGAAVLGGASLPLFTQAAMAEVGLGPPRKIIWVTHSQAEWNRALDVGFTDFGKQSGWEYQKIGVPGGSWTVEDNVNRVKLGIQAKPDVLVGTVIDFAMEDIYVEAEEAGILVVINNSHIDEIQARHVNWGFVGASGHAQGLIVGRKLIPILMEKGKTGGVLVYGNTEPGHAVLTARRDGIAAAAKEFNERDGTSFEVQEFYDQGHDMALSVPLYSTKMRGLGDDLAAFTPSGYTSMIAAFRMLEQNGVEPGEIAIAGPDTGPDIIEGIEKGYIQFAVEQELGNQGYLPGPIAWSRLERGNMLPIMNTGTAVVTKENLELFSWRSEVVVTRSKELGLQY
jgi:ABC-type sugar transport system substrate-binding protein